jgi:hypothetical protein
MKKLMTLMFLGLAAFAGGGMMNEHNLTTFVNYLYHKQQVGTVINLGTITDSPPAELPSTLPATPGAVPSSTAPNASAPAAQTAQARNSDGTSSSGSNATVQQNPAPAASAGAEQLVKGTENVPGSAPPPISIRWPDQTVSTFRTSPNVPPQPASQIPGELPASSPSSQIPETLPPAQPDDSRLASATPHVPPPPIDAVVPPQSEPLRDNQVGRASFGGSSPEKTTESAAGSASTSAWAEVENRMKTLGVVRYEVLGSPDGKKKFRCELAIAGAPKFEADNEDLVQAAHMALKRVVLFHGARKATAAGGRFETQPVAIPASTLPKRTDEATSGMTLPPPPAGPLAPPADLPN